jgi:heavy metal translocating P-type ATPase
LVEESNAQFVRDKLIVKIGGLQCSFCTESVRQAVSRMKGVSGVAVSLSHEEALIEYDPRLQTPAAIKDTLQSIGFSIRDPDKVRSFEEEEAELLQERKRLVAAGVLTLFAATMMLVMWTGYSIPFGFGIMVSLVVLTMFGPGLYIKRLAGASLSRGILNQHVLLEFAAFGGMLGGIIGIFIQPWPVMDFFAVSVFVTSYHVLSGYVSLLVRTRSSQAIKKLMALQPATARVIGPDESETEIPIENLKRGDLVKVLPGESIPVDGIVRGGASSVDESLVTGEPIPVPKEREDEVIGGSLNQRGFLIIEVRKVGEESFLHQIAAHIREARALKPDIVMLVDRILKYFVRGVLLAAIIAFTFWTYGAWLLLGESNLEVGVFSALAVLVMGYPCAIGMATPLALIRGSGIAAQRGVLIRSGEAFQTFKDVRRVVFDKTGTLTMGRPSVIDIVAIDGFSDSEVLSFAATLEVNSEHPLARAVVERALQNGVDLETVDDFHTVPGKGIRGRVRDTIILVGSPEFLKEDGVRESEFPAKLEQMQGEGLTVVAVSVDTVLAGMIAIGDLLKEDAKDVVSELSVEGLEPILVTGDNERTAHAIAEELGISEVHAGVLPQEKSAMIRMLQTHGHKVAMVGDGINDAPALMQSDIGIAIGAGSDIAIESANIVIVGDHLRGVVEAYTICKSSYAKTLQNVLLAFMFNGIGIPFAMTGLLHPVWAMIAMAGSVTAVLANSLFQISK